MRRLSLSKLVTVPSLMTRLTTDASGLSPSTAGSKVVSAPSVQVRLCRSTSHRQQSELASSSVAHTAQFGEEGEINVVETFERNRSNLPAAVDYAHQDRIDLTAHVPRPAHAEILNATPEVECCRLSFDRVEEGREAC